jgi:hypothetical protein
MNAQTTNVSIAGVRTPLAFGTRWNVRYGRDSKILRDALLIDRAANGDLVFDAGEGTLTRKVRVRPSTIDHIVGSGVEHPEPAPNLEDELARQRESDALVEAFVAEGDTDPDSVAARVHAELESRRLDGEPEPSYVEGVLEPANGQHSVISARKRGETATAYLLRIERGLGRGSYARWIGTDAGQAALAAAAEEDRRARNGTPAVLTAAMKKSIRRTLERTESIRDLSIKPRAIVEEYLALVEGISDEVRTAATAFAYQVVEEVRAPLLAAKDPPAFEAKRRPKSYAATGRANDAMTEVRTAKGRPYAERNQVWRCTECKRRTRAPFCENGHDRVEAPAGKRRDDR